LTGWVTQVYGLLINNLAISQTQLGNEANGTDKFLRWRDKSAPEVCASPAAETLRVRAA
jgi:hypothetical protein